VIASQVIRVAHATTAAQYDDDTRCIRRQNILHVFVPRDEAHDYAFNLGGVLAKYLKDWIEKCGSNKLTPLAGLGSMDRIIKLFENVRKGWTLYTK
jgi:hypothetical protein